MRILKRLRSYRSLFAIRLILIGSLCASVSGAQAQISGNYTINSNQPTAGRNFNSFSDALNYFVSRSHRCGNG